MAGAEVDPSTAPNDRSRALTPKNKLSRFTFTQHRTMSRRRLVIHKEEKIDSRYASPVVARLISTVMKNGKKSLAERIVYTAIEETRTGTDTVDPLEVLHKALENVKPRLEVK